MKFNFNSLCYLSVLIVCISCKANTISEKIAPINRMSAKELLVSKNENLPVTDSIVIGDYTRSFSYHISKDLSENPKLIFVLHGSNGTGTDIMRYTENWFNKLADERGNAIIVYPNGYNKHWNECRKEANFEANLLNIDEISFFEKMIGYFSEKYAVAQGEVFVTGHSNGGHMVYKLAKEKPEWFRKYAAVSASLPVAANDDCMASNTPVSIMVLNGTGDNINPYKGGEVNVGEGNKRGKVLSTKQTMHYWASLAGVEFPTTASYDYPDIDKEDGATAKLYKVTSPKFDIELIEVENGGHLLSVPTNVELPAFLGKNIQDINMAEIIYDYFIPKNNNNSKSHITK